MIVPGKPSRFMRPARPTLELFYTRLLRIAYRHTMDPAEPLVAQVWHSYTLRFQKPAGYFG
jgi:hypothetical protein